MVFRGPGPDWRKVVLTAERKSVDRLTDRLDVTIVVDWNVK